MARPPPAVNARNSRRSGKIKTRTARTEGTTNEIETVTVVVTAATRIGKEIVTDRERDRGRDCDGRGNYHRRDDYDDGHRSSRDRKDRDYSHRSLKHYKDYDGGEGGTTSVGITTVGKVVEEK